MNREIKFRTWNGEEMVYLLPTGLQYFDFEGNYVLSFAVDGYKGFWGHEQYQQASNKAAKYPIMQYIDIKDKNGKEIYEGDVLEYLESEAPDYREEWDYEKQGHVPQRAIMRFDETYFGYRLNVQSRFKITLEMVKVIGNIFENPELVNNEK